MKKLTMLFRFIGLLSIAFSTISGFGYVLYNWGSVGLDLGPSTWLGFVLFAKMLGVGVVSLFIYIFIEVQ